MTPDMVLKGDTGAFRSLLDNIETFYIVDDTNKLRNSPYQLVSLNKNGKQIQWYSSDRVNCFNWLWVAVYSSLPFIIFEAARKLE
jgi:hypothetical protein